VEDVVEMVAASPKRKAMRRSVPFAACSVLRSPWQIDQPTTNYNLFISPELPSAAWLRSNSLASRRLAVEQVRFPQNNETMARAVLLLARSKMILA
jgi:hypothetical protein